MCTIELCSLQSLSRKILLPIIRIASAVDYIDSSERRAHHCDAPTVQAPNWQAVEGSCHQTTPASDEEGVDCNVSTVGCISQDQVSDAAQDKTAVQKPCRHWKQAILQSKMVF